VLNRTRRTPPPRGARGCLLRRDPWSLEVDPPAGLTQIEVLPN